MLVVAVDATPSMGKKTSQNVHLIFSAALIWEAQVIANYRRVAQYPTNENYYLMLKIDIWKAFHKHDFIEFKIGGNKKYWHHNKNENITDVLKVRDNE